MVTVSLEREGGRYDTMSLALAHLKSKYSQLSIIPRYSYTIQSGAFVTWFMVYSRGECIGSLYEHASAAVLAHIVPIGYTNFEK